MKIFLKVGHVQIVGLEMTCIRIQMHFFLVGMLILNGVD